MKMLAHLDSKGLICMQIVSVGTTTSGHCYIMALGMINKHLKKK
jgi:hypothetical protein